MKIAILTPTVFNFSGIDRVVEQQINEFIKRGYYVELFTLDSKMDIRGVKTHIIGMPKKILWQRVYRLLFFIDIKKIWKISSQLKGFDVVYSHQYPMNWIASAAKLRFRNKYIYYDYGIARPENFSSQIEK